MPEPVYVFLDSNIIFSAAYKDDSPFLELWSTPEIAVVSSLYAANEVRRNCRSEQQLKRLEILLSQTMMVSDASQNAIPSSIDLPEKDRPILASAIDAGAAFLITGDKNHFAQWMNRPIKTRHGMLIIMEPGPFLDLLDEGGLERLGALK